MVSPVQENGQSQSNLYPAVPIVIIGTDAMLAALPATPVQLAHACMLAGFANVIPVSWGDELIAAAMLRRLAPNGGPAVQCSCPKVAQRLLGAGTDLRPILVPLVAPPVATARYIRSASQPTRVEVTYAGSCPGSVDDSIDVHMTPEELLAFLAEREIVPEDQPRVFEGVIPPDRRRYRSQPGGLPTADALWSDHGGRSLIEIDGDDISTEIAQHIFSGRTVLIDVSARLGCVCAGAIDGVEPSDARHQVVAHEPPRANTPIVNETEPIELDLSTPSSARTSATIVAALEAAGHASPSNAREPEARVSADPPSANSSTPANGAAQPTNHQSRISPTPGVPTIADPRPARTSSVTPPRPVLGSIPVARAVDGKALPRAYFARRRPSPRSIDAIPPGGEILPQLYEELRPGERIEQRATESLTAPRDTASPAERPLTIVTHPHATPDLAPATLHVPPPVEPTPLPAPVVPTPSASLPPAETTRFAALLRTQRPLWLVVLLGFFVLIAGIGLGVVVARSFGLQSVPPPSESR